MDPLNPDYLNTFKYECIKIEQFLNNFSYFRTSEIKMIDNDLMLSYYCDFINSNRKLTLIFYYNEFFPSKYLEDKTTYSLNLYINNSINESKSFNLNTYLEDYNLEKSIITRYKDSHDFNQTIRDFFQHVRRLLANELKDTLLGNEVHDHAERAMQSYVDHIYDSPTLAQNLYQKQIAQYRKKMSVYDQFIEWNSRLIANLEIHFFRFVTPILRFLNSLFEDKK